MQADLCSPTPPPSRPPPAYNPDACHLNNEAQADRSMESLFAELVSNGILRRTPSSTIQDYLGASGLMGSTLEAAGLLPDASMAQVGGACRRGCSTHR